MEEHTAKIDWNFRAMDELSDIRAYMAEQTSEDKAEAFVNDLLQEVQNLAKNPGSFPYCRNQKLQTKGYRCINFKKYIIIYFVENNIVQIIAILHSHRDPKYFDEIAK